MKCCIIHPVYVYYMYIYIYIYMYLRLHTSIEEYCSVCGKHMYDFRLSIPLDNLFTVTERTSKLFRVYDGYRLV